jgi:hypothetical protein
MKTLLSLLAVPLFLFVTTLNAQQQYTVDGKQHSLIMEIEGPLTLLWNTIDGEYRYFSKKGNDILELKNSKVDGKYQEDYKETLRAQTQEYPIDLAKVNFTRPSLANFFVAYNKAADPNFMYESPSVQLKTRLAAFGGISNNVYTENSTNALSPVLGIDFEIVDESKLKRHSMVVRFKQTLENSDTNYSASQFSLNYRFKFVKSSKLDVFINTKFVAYTYIKNETTFMEDGITRIESNSGGSFQAPIAFGLGADYAVGKGYITFCYNDIVGLGIENVDGNFPVDFTLGYKFNL